MILRVPLRTTAQSKPPDAPRNGCYRCKCLAAHFRRDCTATVLKRQYLTPARFSTDWFARTKRLVSRISGTPRSPPAWPRCSKKTDHGRVRVRIKELRTPTTDGVALAELSACVGDERYGRAAENLDLGAAPLPSQRLDRWNQPPRPSRLLALHRLCSSGGFSNVPFCASVATLCWRSRRPRGCCCEDSRRTSVWPAPTNRISRLGTTARASPETHKCRACGPALVSTDQRFALSNAALKMNEASETIRSYAGKTGNRGGVSGSYPIWGAYQPRAISVGVASSLPTLFSWTELYAAISGLAMRVEFPPEPL